MPNPQLRRREGLRAAYRRLSSQKQWALEHMTFAVPTHQTRLAWLQIRPSTLRALEKLGLAQPLALFAKDSTTPLPFWTLTQAGEAIRRAVFH